ncbi:hypothetical protein H1R20_g9086, partial [Candolleomyces eurysporus]
MQSSWQRIAREALRCSGPANFRPFRPPKSLKTNSISSQCRSAHATVAAHASGSSSLADADEPCTPAFDQDGLKRPLTHSRVALEAANAIRLAVSQGNLPDAYLILNSVYYAKNRSSPSPLMTSLLSLLSHKAFNPEAIPFNPQTPTRLVTHSLLHSLVRYGYLPEAARLSEELMKNDIKIHWASLDTVFKALADPSIPSDSRPSSKRFTAKHTILSTTPIPEAYFSHQGGTYALRLLNVARQSRQRRTRGMFKTLIALCIINGEIIMASLIFGLMVKDWNARVLELAGTQEDPPPRPESNDPKDVVSWAALVRNRRVTPWPSESRLEEILVHIDEILRIGDHSTEAHQQAALQTLANLAVLLDERLLPFECVGSLIRMLTRAQNCRGSVKVPSKGGHGVQTVQASSFFRSVLLRLSADLPLVASPRHASIQPPDPRNKGFLPALDANGYNHLLRFALNHERSVDLADKIVKHMTVVREPPLKPTYAIIERFRQGAVRLHSEDLWKRAAELEGMITPGYQTQSGKLRIPLPLRYARLLDHPDSSPRETMARIDFLVTSGNAEQVEPFIGRVLPGFDERQVALKNGCDVEGEEENMRLAVSRGPRFIVSVLNALAKTHRAHIAERVWEYAKAVEAFSWTTSPDPERGVLPWTLPIQAYTLMLDIYAMVSRKGEEYRWERSEDGKGDRKKWVPVPKIPKEQNSTGRGTKTRTERKAAYARIVKFDARTAREKALEVYRSARDAYEGYAPMVDQLLSSSSSSTSSSSSQDHRRLLHPSHELPAPDAIFYNSILEIVERDSRTVPRITKLDEAERQLRDAERLYDMSGVLLQERTEELLMVGRDMLDGGFPIPPGLRPYFVGSGLKCDENDEGGDSARRLWQGRSLFRLRVDRKRRWAVRRRDDRKAPSMTEQGKDLPSHMLAARSSLRSEVAM